MAKKAPKKKKKPAAHADVESYKHAEAKRKNIPTAGNQKLVADEDKAIKKLRWKRNPDLDPQLVWRGKDFEADPLEVDVPPIYIQEKIQPRAIIEDLRRQSKERSKDAAPQFDFFHDFNGLPEGWKEDATQSYYHDEGNWQNRMILGDSLLVMASLAERESLRGKVQCIYMDPPYGIRFNSNWQPSTKSRDVREGQESSVSREPEVIRAFRDTWSDGIHSYLDYLRDRLVAARDLLHERGSIFVQIGDENVHYVRNLLEEVFEKENFIAEIVFQKTSSTSSDELSGVFDYILWFGRTSAAKYRALYELKSPGEQGATQYTYGQDDKGVRWTLVEWGLAGISPGHLRIFSHDNITSQRPPQGEDVREFGYEGKRFPLKKGTFKTDQVGLERLAKAKRMIFMGNTLRYVRFLNDFRIFPFSNLWTDTVTSGFADPKVYVVQTNKLRGGPGLRDSLATWLRWIPGLVTPPISPRLPA